MKSFLHFLNCSPFVKACCVSETVPARTAMDIQAMRKGSEPAVRASDFPRQCTEEKLLPLSMLADAAEESLGVTRFFDADDFDVSTVPQTI